MAHNVVLSGRGAAEGPNLKTLLRGAVMVNYLFYELYVCGHKCGCKTLSEFFAEGDMQAAKKANAIIDEHEESTGDNIYREYLYRTEEGVQVEIAL